MVDAVRPAGFDRDAGVWGVVSDRVVGGNWPMVSRGLGEIVQGGTDSSFFEGAQSADELILRIAWYETSLVDAEAWIRRKTERVDPDYLSFFSIVLW